MEKLYTKKLFLKFLKIYRKTLVPEPFFHKVAKPCNFIMKENLAQVFSCEFYKF